jgi:hypothetical protein
VLRRRHHHNHRTSFTDGWAFKSGTSLTTVIAAQRTAGFANPQAKELITSTIQALFYDPHANDPGIITGARDQPTGQPAARQVVPPPILDPDTPPAWAQPGPTWDPFVSPYLTPLEQDAFCKPTTDILAAPYSVDGFPSSPFRIIPFTRKFKNPPFGQISGRACRQDDHCSIGYDINVHAARLDVFSDTIPGCNGVGTNFMTYNGSVPGPTLVGPV